MAKLMTLPLEHTHIVSGQRPGLWRWLGLEPSWRSRRRRRRSRQGEAAIAV